MKVLITGATGFIGSHVARRLVKEGCEVYAIARESSDLWRINDIVPNLNLLRFDLLDVDTLNNYLEKIRPYLCIHCAWYAVPGKYLNAPENLTILNTSLHLASKLADLGCQRFIGIGTCVEYDTTIGYLSEDSPTKARSLYAASKLGLQVVLEQLANVTGMQVAWVRLFYQYGAFEDERRLVPSVICALLREQVARLTKGEQLRDFLHVEDVAAAICAVARSKRSGVFNVGSGKPIAVQDIATIIGSIVGRAELIALGAMRYPPSEPMFICANNRRLIENTSWVPQYTLEQGLHETIAWWQKHL